MKIVPIIIFLIMIILLIVNVYSAYYGKRDCRATIENEKLQDSFNFKYEFLKDLAAKLSILASIIIVVAYVPFIFRFIYKYLHIYLGPLSIPTDTEWLFYLLALVFVAAPIGVVNVFLSRALKSPKTKLISLLISLPSIVSSVLFLFFNLFETGGY